MGLNEPKKSPIFMGLQIKKLYSKDVEFYIYPETSESEYRVRAIYF